MKNKLVLSLFTIGVLGANILNAADDLSSMFSNAKVSGDIREFTISRSVHDTRSAKEDYTRVSNAVGGYLKYETDAYRGLRLGAAFYTTNGFLLDSPKDDYTQVDPTLLGKDNDSYSILGEAYLEYRYKKTEFKGGRQKINTPLAGADDARMLPNLFEAYILTNKDLKDTTLMIGHLNRFAQGTFGRVYTSGMLPLTSGYSYVDSRDQVGEFVNMGTYAVGKSTSGVSFAAVEYNGIKGLKTRVWDYYAYDIFNAIYADISYSIKSDGIKPFVAAQIISESDVGKSYLGNLSGFYWAAKVGVNISDFVIYAAYSSTTANGSGDDATKNAIVSPWGGMPAYTQGMVTRHMFLAGTDAYKVATSYNFKSVGVDLKTVLYYAYYDIAANNGYTEDDTDEFGFDFIYYPAFIKNLQLRFRANFSNDFYVKNSSDDPSLNGSVGWDEYRFIMNYKF